MTAEEYKQKRYRALAYIDTKVLIQHARDIGVIVLPGNTKKLIDKIIKKEISNNNARLRKQKP